MMLLLMAAGMLVFVLGISSGIASNAQTAADAAALAGEQELVNELKVTRFGPNGEILPPTYDRTKVCQSAEHYAQLNHGTMSCPGDIQFISVSGLFGTDVLVTVHSQGSVPNGNIDPGTTAVAQARASTDPYTQASPPISTTLSCDASVVDGTPFDPPTDKGDTSPGFFAKSGTDYTKECEPKLSGKIEDLAKAKKLHLVGVLGYATSTPSSATDPSSPPGLSSDIEQAHACGAASQTTGLDKIDDATLRSFGLDRPIPGARDQIELLGAAACKQRVSSAPGQSAPVLPGNSDVHLVDLSGGPVGAFSLGVPGTTIQADATAMQLGCIIYQVDLQMHVKPKVLLASFLAAWAESTMRNITTYTPNEDESLGLFQQQQKYGWGTPAQETDPVQATEMFLGGTGPGTPFYSGSNADPGAIQVDAAHPDYTPWFLTEQVQHSQFLDGSNYEAQMGTAQNMINEIQGGACDTQGPKGKQ
ncbi:MAG: hypothetical protein ACTHMY_24845 [Solirubrobacteraceae bacterium]